MGKTPALIYHREADLYLRLLVQIQSLYGAGGTDLSAEGAAIFTVSQSRDQHGGPYPFNTSLKERRLEPVCEAHLHALAALDAPFQKFPFLEGTGRTDQ